MNRHIQSAMARAPLATRSHRSCVPPRAFTLLDVLVTIAVIAVLISIMLPSLGKVNETARRVVCRSNIRQIGLGVIMYADAWNGQLPATRFVANSQTPSRGGDNPQRTVTVRLDDGDPEATNQPWDGLGLLFQLGFLDAPKVFYCPSHWGENPYRRYARQWSPYGGEIVCNYHFRGEGPTHPGRGSSAYGQTTTALYLIDPAFSSLIADSMEVRSDYNHRVGVNFFRADLTVHWYDDPTGSLLYLLPSEKNSPGAADRIEQAWRRFDESVASGSAGSPR